MVEVFLVHEEVDNVAKAVVNDVETFKLPKVYKIIIADDLQARVIVNVSVDVVEAN